MKELTHKYKESEIVIVEEQQQRKEIKLIGSQNKIKGLTLWQFNESTKELSIAKFRPASIFISSSINSSETTKNFTVVVNENCIYFQALNESNAKRKLRKAKLL